MALALNGSCLHPQVSIGEGGSDGDAVTTTALLSLMLGGPEPRPAQSQLLWSSLGKAIRTGEGGKTRGS